MPVLLLQSSVHPLVVEIARRAVIHQAPFRFPAALAAAGAVLVVDGGKHDRILLLSHPHLSACAGHIKLLGPVTSVGSKCKLVRLQTITVAVHWRYGIKKENEEDRQEKLPERNGRDVVLYR